MSGIYIHIPFCLSKCAYCDFYSIPFSEKLEEDYVERIISEINRWGSGFSCPADTLYFGGGTPSLLKAENIAAIITAAKKFLTPSSEITLEVNPAESLEEYFKAVATAGVNRVSFGMQSADDTELKILGRRHCVKDVEKGVLASKKAGIDNISLDVMLGIPNQNEKSLEKTLDFALSLGVPHISTYMLSFEKGTKLYENRSNYNIPTEDVAADYYLLTCDKLKSAGFERYEISNFAKDKKYSKHNIKYWTGEDYIGLGPAAHSLIAGKRFYYDRNLVEYINNPTEIDEGAGSTLEERVMLSLRLISGLSISELFKDFSSVLAGKTPDRLIKKAGIFKKAGLVNFDGDKISLTDKGAVVSNSIITEFLMCI